MAVPLRWTPETLACALCGASDTGTLPDLDRKGWDWFAGYLPRTAVCPHCVSTRRAVRDRIVEQSLRKPEAPNT